MRQGAEFRHENALNIANSTAAYQTSQAAGRPRVARLKMPKRERESTEPRLENVRGIAPSADGDGKASGRKLSCDTQMRASDFVHRLALALGVDAAREDF